MLVLGVHGIGQQYKADTVIHDEWWSKLRGGIHLAGGELENPNHFRCAFYGHLFREKGALSAAPAGRPGDLQGEELELLQLLWKNASEAEPDKVPAPEFYQSAVTMAATPKFVQRALNALSKSSFCVGIAQNMMIGDLQQVVRYFKDPQLREDAVESVTSLITPETRVVVGHSLGSVVAYEALHRKPANVRSFVSIGSPLGIPNLIFHRLRPGPGALGICEWPGKVRLWTNIADKGDVVANPKLLQPLFGGELKDLPVSNGSDAHHGERYLTAVESGRAVLEGLTAN